MSEVSHERRGPSVPAECGARFSTCRRYRLALWRTWGTGPRINWIMLNPSTADERFNDATIERCQRRSRRLGFDSMIVTNLFALRSTHPEGLYQATDPVGPGNIECLAECAGAAGCVVAAWGAHGRLLDQGARVEHLLIAAGVELLAFRLTRTGQPGHPLYLPYAAPLRRLAELRGRTPVDRPGR